MSMSNLYHKLEETSVLTKIISIFGRAETPSQKLWREVYVAKIQCGVSQFTAVAEADYAVQAFRERNL